MCHASTKAPVVLAKGSSGLNGAVPGRFHSPLCGAYLQQIPGGCQSALFENPVRVPLGGYDLHL